jgi:DNA-binding response OmpR family regulator
VDVHVARLRDKLKGGGVRIETVWGTGYRLVPEA